ncbi:MAG TPA: hypothetical protein VMI34_19830 [Candidatus Bathyarchaeia archaeon]|nr:hypothetical protein [Candidatus Bathyarchaeia archaeon]
MPLGRRERSRDRLLVWAFALGLIAVLTGLFVATSESLRHQEHDAPVAGAVQPELPVPPSSGEGTYHEPNAAGWRAP